jgi:hypothetical protein
MPTQPGPPWPLAPALIFLAGMADPQRLWRLLGARGIGTDEIGARFGRHRRGLQLHRR